MNIGKATTLSILLTLLTLCCTSVALAANLATISMQNDTFAEKFKYSIDIYAISTEDSFGVGDTSIALEFNDAVLSNYVLSNQNALFHNNANYNAMAIVLDPEGVGATNRIALSISLAGGGVGATLPDTDTRLATITFDIDSNSAVYRNETTGFVGLTGLSSMTSSPNTGLVFFTWNDSLDDSLICTPEISGAPGTSVAAGNLYDFTPTAVDVCNTTSVGALSFSIASDPAWSSFDTNTGRLSGTPDSGDVGTHSNIVITVSDVYGDSASLSAFDVEVTSSSSAGDSSGSGGGGGGGGCFISNLLFP
jgi:hypothetical protein